MLPENAIPHAPARLSRSDGVRRPTGVQFSIPLAWAFPRWIAGSVVACLVLALVPACDSSGGPPGGGGAGGGGDGGGGGCLVVPQPTFALSVLAEAGGPLPPDTTVQVRWSAGDEPPFHLDDPASWPTLDSSSVQCDVDPDAPPTGLEKLTCALWTASPTEVSVSAQGYVTEEHTYTAEPMTGCNPEPTPIEIELAVVASR